MGWFNQQLDDHLEGWNRERSKQFHLKVLDIFFKNPTSINFRFGHNLGSHRKKGGKSLAKTVLGWNIFCFQFVQPDLGYLVSWLVISSDGFFQLPTRWFLIRLLLVNKLPVHATPLWFRCDLYEGKWAILYFGSHPGWRGEKLWSRSEVRIVSTRAFWSVGHFCWTVPIVWANDLSRLNPRGTSKSKYFWSKLLP